MNELEAKALVKSLSTEELKDLIEFMEVLFQMREAESMRLAEVLKNR